MKVYLSFCFILLLLSAPAFAELSVKDIEVINKIVTESEARMKEYVAQEIAKVNVKIDALDQRLTSEIRAIDKRFDDVNKRFDDVNKRLDSHFFLILALVGLIGVVIGIPQILVVLQRKHQRAQEEKLEQQQAQIQEMLKEIETLKKKAISTPTP